MVWLGKMEQSNGRKEQKTGGKGNLFLICSYLFSECIEGMIFLCGNFMPKDQRLKSVATEKDQISNTVIPAQLCVHTVGIVAVALVSELQIRPHFKCKAFIF